MYKPKTNATDLVATTILSRFWFIVCRIRFVLYIYFIFIYFFPQFLCFLFVYNFFFRFFLDFCFCNK